MSQPGRRPVILDYMEVGIEMKYVFALIVFATMLAGQAAAMQMPPGTNGPTAAVKAPIAIVTDALTGQVLYERNAHARRPVASTTKIMTAILVIENAKDLDAVVTVGAAPSKAPFTSLHLAPGEQVTVRNLLSALLIRSANDTAVALAEYIGGTMEGFARMMNDKAKRMGLKDTHFVNPNGLYVPGHYSSAYDLALMARYAMRYPVFNEIVATRRMRIERSINKQDVLVQSHAKFLKSYEGADGVKSGYTREAGHCFVGSATHGGWRLVSVVLKSPDSQGDTTALMDYGFKNYERVLLARTGQPVARVPVRGGKTELDAVPDRDVHVVVKPGEAGTAKVEKKLDDVHAPIRKGETVGTMTAFIGDKPIVTVLLKAAEDVGETTASIAWPWIRTILLLGTISIGAVCGRTSAKSLGRRRSRLS